MGTYKTDRERELLAPLVAAHARVEKAERRAEAERAARDAVIAALLDSGETSAYRVAQVLGITQPAVAKAAARSRGVSGSTS